MNQLILLKQIMYRTRTYNDFYRLQNMDIYIYVNLAGG